MQHPLTPKSSDLPILFPYPRIYPGMSNTCLPLNLSRRLTIPRLFQSNMRECSQLGIQRHSSESNTASLLTSYMCDLKSNATAPVLRSISQSFH